MSYKEEVQKIKDLRRSGISDTEEVKLPKFHKKEDKPFILEIVYNGKSFFLKGHHVHGKYTTLKRAKQALEQGLKSMSWARDYIVELNVYHIDDKNTILANHKNPLCQ